MATAQNLLSNSFGCGFVRYSPEKSYTDFYETIFLCSMHSLEDYEVLYIRVLKMRLWTLKLVFW